MNVTPRRRTAFPVKVAKNTTVFILLIDVKMLTIVDFLTSVSGMNFSTIFVFSSVFNSVFGYLELEPGS